VLRLTKGADYGLVLLTHLAQQPEASLANARGLADATRLPAPMVTKILKQLVMARILDARRGVGGGYVLARPASRITVAEILEALEGPLALTECSEPSGEGEGCERVGFCQVREHTQLINDTIWRALGEITLADLTRPASRELFQLGPPLPSRIAATPVR